jgi:hypothetical protein
MWQTATSSLCWSKRQVGSLATEQNIGGDGHAIGKVRKGYEACIGEGGNKVQMSELCAGQSSEIFTQIVSALRNL